MGKTEKINSCEEENLKVIEKIGGGGKRERASIKRYSAGI